MIMESFKSYRFRLGLVGKNVSKQELNNAKKRYRKAYQKEYRKRRKSEVVRKEISLTKKEAQLLSDFSATHQFSESSCLKICAFSVIENHSPVLHPKALSDLIFQLRKVGVNINQMAFKVNQNQFQEFDEKYLLEQVSFMEQLIRTSLSSNYSKDTIRDTITTIFKHGH